MFTLAFISTFLLIFLIGLIIPLLVGILVYRDAEKRVDCNPWLWALIAALAPSFIGLIIYLVVRGDFPLKPESIRYDEFGNPIQPQKKGFPTWGKAALIVLAVLIVICIVGGCGAMLVGLFGYNTISPEHFYYEF